MKIVRNIFLLSFILVFVGCLDENDSIEVEGNDEDYKRSLVAISRDEQPTDDSSSFRTMDQIKEDLKDLNMDVKLDSEIIKELLKKLGGDDDDLSEEDELLILEDLEYHLHHQIMEVKLDSEMIKELLGKLDCGDDDLSVGGKLDLLEDLKYHLRQIDNANMFVDVGGLSRLVRIINTTTGFDVQCSALMAISAALQSNPHAQVVAVTEGLMEFCLRIAMTTASKGGRRLVIHNLSDNLIASEGVRGWAVDALSAMMRNFPFAQKRFADLGGFEFLVGLLGEEPPVDETVIKVVSFVSDLMEEQVTTKQDEYLNPDYKKEKLAQVQLVDRILGTEWCQMLPRLLERGGWDIKEKTVKAMWSWIDSCKNHFLSTLPTLNDLRNNERICNDDFSLEVCGIVERIVGKIDAKDEL